MICGGNSPSLAINADNEYQDFCKKYNISLNLQQESALRSIDGANMLLAVPGSGKTTVLVARLGYMVLNKHIPPKSILAITFGKDADREMEQRFVAKFGSDIGRGIKFCTINSLSNLIYTEYCRNKSRPKRELIQDNEKRGLIKEILKHHRGEYPGENDIRELSDAITYIKNMMLTDEQICEIENTGYPDLNAMYQSYQKALKEKCQMDFDDQMVYAYEILQKRKSVAEEWRAKYKYICVDEAQDTSKIQHEIIKIFARGNNIFMVGDDDQSIYHFRGAYSETILNFESEYPNSTVLYLEKNYRSTSQIVEKAQAFISQNKGRYEKNMTAERGSGEEVHLIRVFSRADQYVYLLDIAKKASSETAFLYRDNESAVVLIDLFSRNNIPFKLRKREMNFFGNRVVKDIVAYLSLALNENDTDSFSQICNKGIIYLQNKQKDYAIKNCKYKHMSIYDAVEGQMQYRKEYQRAGAENFRKIMRRVAKETSLNAISILMNSGYEEYLRKNHLDSGKVEILSILAKREPNIQNFLKRLEELEGLIQKGFYPQANNAIILSTIHSSKGLEYDNVYMVDIYDGRLPSSRQNVFSCFKKNEDGEQEERRLFYVGITRAKNRLSLFGINGRKSTFIDQLFPEHKMMREKEEEDKCKQFRDAQEQRHSQSSGRCAEQECILQEQLRIEHEKTLEIERVRQKQMAQTRLVNCYNEVKDKFTQQEYQIRDSSGRRWVQCELCGEIKPKEDFVSYGGMNRINLGICEICSCRGKQG